MTDSLFENRGFSIRMWTPKTENELIALMYESGFKSSILSNTLRQQVMGFKPGNASDPKYAHFQSRALLTIVAGTNEMEYLAEINEFVKFGKANGFLIEALIENETYPYETSPLVYLEKTADVFVF